MAYLWNFAGGAENSDEKDPENVVFGEPGDYPVTYVVTDENGKQALAEMRLTVIPNLSPEASVLSPDPDRIVDAGGSVSFEGEIAGGNPPFDFLWDFGPGGLGTESRNQEI